MNDYQYCSLCGKQLSGTNPHEGHLCTAFIANPESSVRVWPEQKTGVDIDALRYRLTVLRLNNYPDVSALWAETHRLKAENDMLTAERDALVRRMGEIHEEALAITANPRRAAFPHGPWDHVEQLSRPTTGDATIKEGEWPSQVKR